VGGILRRSEAGPKVVTNLSFTNAFLQANTREHRLICSTPQKLEFASSYSVSDKAVSGVTAF